MPARVTSLNYKTESTLVYSPETFWFEAFGVHWAFSVHSVAWKTSRPSSDGVKKGGNSFHNFEFSLVAVLLLVNMIHTFVKIIYFYLICKSSDICCSFVTRYLCPNSTTARLYVDIKDSAFYPFK